MKHPPTVKRYVAVTVGLAAAVAAAIYWHWGAPTWTQVAFLWTLHAATLADRIEVPVARLSLVRDEAERAVGLSPGFVIVLTAAFATDPATAVTIGLIPAIPALVNREEREVLKLTFNSAQEGVFVAAAAVIFSSMRSLEIPLVSSFVAAALAAVVALALNTMLVGGVVAVDKGVSTRDVVRRMTWMVPHSLGFGMIALMIATLYRDHGAVAAVFLVMPLAALRIALQARLRLDSTRERTLTDFVRAVEAKDPYTFRHSERVAAISVELHRELGAGRAELERRWTAALLHDIGKIAIPPEILTKAGPLTDDEYDIIKEHPGVGSEAVAQIDLFADLTAEVLHHHERMDGRGYPARLAGEQIPYLARVLAVADAFEALTSDRPYRAALSTDTAMLELERTAGKHHDPVVVAALRRVLDRGVSFVRPTLLSDAEERHSSAAVGE